MKSYDVSLHTPIGKRKGEMKVNIEDGKLIGFLTLFRNTEPLSGSIDENGECTLKGKFITLLKPVYFTATGKIHDEDLQLVLKCECGNYKMLGSSQKGKEAGI